MNTNVEFNQAVSVEEEQKKVTEEEVRKKEAEQALEELENAEGRGFERKQQRLKERGDDSGS